MGGRGGVGSQTQFREAQRQESQKRLWTEWVIVITPWKTFDNKNSVKVVSKTVATRPL